MNVLTERSTYSGNMSITINNRTTVTIPNNQLLFEERWIADSGLVQANSKATTIPIVRIQPGDSMMPRLGGMFFSSAYLMVNHDKSEFSVAQAQPKAVPPRIMAFDTTNDCVAQVIQSVSLAPTQSGNSGNSRASSGPDTSRDTTHGALSGGVIAGITIGVVACIALLAGIVFLLRRRKYGLSGLSGPSEMDDGTLREKYSYDVSEMHAGGEQHEMAHADHKLYTWELDGSDRPHEAP
jgi:hypothetical protein